MDTITYQLLTIDKMDIHLLDSFNRYQNVTKCFRNHSGTWELEDIAFVEDWDLPKRQSISARIREAVLSGGRAIGAFDKSKLVGLALLGKERFGSKSQYIELQMLHVSVERRGFGIGKTLFQRIAEEAKKQGAKKLYISAHSAMESQAFYKAVGCVFAEEINEELAEKDPCDCQLEYIL